MATIFSTADKQDVVVWVDKAGEAELRIGTPKDIVTLTFPTLTELLDFIELAHFKALKAMPTDEPGQETAKSARLITQEMLYGRRTDVTNRCSECGGYPDEHEAGKTKTPEKKRPPCPKCGQYDCPNLQGCVIDEPTPADEHNPGPKPDPRLESR